MFHEWLFSEEPRPYGSFGNGAAMRISPVALLYPSLEEARPVVYQITAVTHDHPEGLKGAEAAVAAILLAREGRRPDEIRRFLQERYGDDLSPSLDEIRPGYRFDESCQGTVPAAILCALEAVDFEDALRNAVSRGGDADTLAAIAEARFGVPKPIAREAHRRLPAEMQGVLAELYRAAGAPEPWYL